VHFVDFTHTVPFHENDKDTVLIEKMGVKLADFTPLKWEDERCMKWHIVDGDFTYLHVWGWFSRNSSFYLWNGAFLLFVLQVCNLCTWAVHWRSVDSRLALDVTLLLVAVAFKQTLSGYTPPVGYLNMLDIYSLISIGLLFISALLHAAIGFMFKDCDTITGICEFYEGGVEWQDKAYTMDQATLAVAYILTMALNTFWCIRAFQIIENNGPANMKKELIKTGKEKGFKLQDGFFVDGLRSHATLPGQGRRLLRRSHATLSKRGSKGLDVGEMQVIDITKSLPNLGMGVKKEQIYCAVKRIPVLGNVDLPSSLPWASKRYVVLPPPASANGGPV
jgi:hypothetical protein